LLTGILQVKLIKNQMFNIDKIIEFGFWNRYTPVSDHLASVVKNLLYLNEQENRYLQWFDFFEFLFSFKMTQQISKTYFGSFSWRLENNSRIQRFIFKQIQYFSSKLNANHIVIL
jgi:hypothetical protein